MTLGTPVLTGSALVERMAVEVAGSGDAVVLVHGLGGTSNVWTPLTKALRGRRAVQPDLPGSGRSPRPSGTLSIASMVEALARMARYLGIERADFVGHSLGTVICCHLAAEYPRLVRGLALFGPLLAPAEATRDALRQRARKVRDDGMASVADAILTAATSADTRENQPVTVALVRELLMRQDAEGYAATCEALASAEPADLSRLRCRALLVTGDEDAVAPPSGARAMAERLEGARVEILPRCGHWTTLERAADSNRLLREFLMQRG